MKIVAVVPAWNEAPTISPVIHTIVRSLVFAETVVIDDGSTDGTFEAASDVSEAVVIRHLVNRGKSAAMLTGADVAFNTMKADAVAFFDADLIGLRRDHCVRLVAPVQTDEFEMSCGIRDYGPIGNLIQEFGPLITGERVFTRRVYEAIPKHLMTGFSAETVINATCENICADVCVQLMDGMNIRRKESKFGLVDGIRRYLSMYREIVDAERACDEYFETES